LHSSQRGASFCRGLKPHSFRVLIELQTVLKLQSGALQVDVIWKETSFIHATVTGKHIDG
jgi:hypothetical protein